MSSNDEITHSEDDSDLEDLFNDALTCLGRGEVEEAKQLHKRILEQDPRLPEPYLELAVIAHDEGDLDNAVAAARLAIELLEKGGQWLDNLAPNVMLGHAKTLLGRLLSEQAQSGDTPFDPKLFPALWNEASRLFAEAHELDPNNEDARTNAVLHQPVEHQPVEEHQPVDETAEETDEG